MKPCIIPEETAETIKNQSEMIKSQGFIVSTTAKQLKDEIKKNRLLMEFLNRPEQEEILKEMLDHIKSCPECELHFIEKINRCDSCIYFDSCKDEDKKPGCKKREENTNNKMHPCPYGLEIKLVSIVHKIICYKTLSSPLASHPAGI